MPRGHAPKREAKKPRKKDAKKVASPSADEFISPEVEVVGKRKKPREWEPVA
jgi:hypothetical protein